MDEVADVLIVGAGPVGLALAMDLAWRGVSPKVVELRAKGEPPNVKCNHVSARSMENFRRLGIVADIRDAGLPEDYPHDIVYKTSFLGQELTRIPIPCRRDRYSVTTGPDADWPTPEPPHRINQIYLEPILARHAQETFAVDISFRTELVSYEAVADGTNDGIVALLRDLDTGEERRLRARYLIGCDGGRSAVRRQMGARLVGDPVVQRVQSTYIRAPELLRRLERQGGVPGWGSASLNPRRSGIVYAIDGRELWLIHNYLREEEADFDAVDRDGGIRAILGVDETFSYEIVSREDWFGRRLVADRFRNGRVFLCGDAAHIWVPFAGYGMNAGLADAFNLSWLLAAQLKGWAAASILDAYEAERLPITEQVSHYAMQHALQSSRQRRAVAANIEAPGPEGDAVRAATGRAAYDLNVQQYCCAGLNFGYFYDQSPLVAYDGETAPGYSMGTYEPSTVPGTRLPHLWLADGRSLYDALGRDYTLVTTRPVETAALVAAAGEAGLPLALLDLSDETLPETYRHAMVLARPDGHIAWRGDAAPRDAKSLIDTLRGAGPARAVSRAA